ncbi:MAG TPA: exopolysaccharide biosynthesis protein, partial [Pirellulaceae bacterium]|nr:exopolysaccharide biosynthesis protein [Pirellulaceae bacterium]
MSTTEGAHELTDVMDQLVDNTEGETITLDELFQSLDSRSYGPLLLVVGLIAISPIGGIPGMSLVTGSLIMILCLQMMMGRSHPWLPERLMSIEFPRERLERTV